MNFDLLVTLGVILLAGIYLVSRFRKKSGGCCGCTGCSNDLKPKPTCACSDNKN